MSVDTSEQDDRGRWLNRGVGAIGSASFFSDLGHEIPTALLPSLLTTTLGALWDALVTGELLWKGMNTVRLLFQGYGTGLFLAAIMTTQQQTPVRQSSA